MKKFLKNQKGITMMEVLVTVGLLAIVIVPCLSSFVMAQRGNALASQVYYEYTEAQNLMETLKGIQVSEEGGIADWKAIVESTVTTVQDNGQDGISVVCTSVEKPAEVEGGEKTFLYYEISIHSGEGIPTEDNLILEGVIAP